MSIYIRDKTQVPKDNEIESERTESEGKEGQPESQKSLTDTMERIMGRNLAENDSLKNRSHSKQRQQTQQSPRHEIIQQVRRQTDHKGRLLRDSATEEDLTERHRDDDEESKEMYGSPMLSPRSNKPSEHITYRSQGLLSKNLSVRGTNHYEPEQFASNDPTKKSFNSRQQTNQVRLGTGDSSQLKGMTTPLLTHGTLDSHFNNSREERGDGSGASHSSRKNSDHQNSAIETSKQSIHSDQVYKRSVNFCDFDC